MHAITRDMRMHAARALHAITCEICAYLQRVGVRNQLCAMRKEMR